MAETPETPPEWMTVGQAAALTGLSTDTIRRYHKTGRLRGLRTPNNQRRFLRSDVLALLAEEDETEARAR